MKTIKILDECDIHSQDKKEDSEYTKTRDAVRVVIFDESDRIALNYYPPKKDYPDKEYGIPGGGVDEGETILEAVHRESLEETGCKIKSLDELGVIVERGVSPNLIQKTHCYTGRVDGDKGEPLLTEKERGDDLKLEWLKLDDAINAIKNNLEGFTKERGLVILNKLKAEKTFSN